LTTQSNPKIPRVHFENLDALRFFAAISVVLFHFFRDVNADYPALNSYDIFKGVMVIANKGGLGVNFFFVLSGFLITYLIMHEHKHRGHFNLWKFLIRRTLRIWPLYFIIFFIGFALFPWIIPGYSTSHDPMYFAFFLANFDEIWNGANDSIGFLTSPWSVAVEEQFYLFWGIGLFILSRMKFLKPEYLILIMYVVSFYFRWYYLQDHRMIFYHTLSVGQDILMGAIIGLLLFRENRFFDKLKTIPKIWVILIYLGGFLMCVAKNKIFSGDFMIMERFALSLFFAFIILDQVRGEHSFFKFGSVKMFNYFGKISYGIYMYHLVIMYLVLKGIEQVEHGGYWLIPTYLFVSLFFILLVSGLSYRFIEAKFLNLKPK